MSTHERVLRERLKEIEDRNGGVLTPALVVDDARDPASPLHAQFEWDEKKLVQKALEDQARMLIRRIRVVETTETIVISAPAYVRDPTSAHGAQGYVSAVGLRGDEDRKRDAFSAEMSRVLASMARAQDLARLWGLDGEFTAVIKATETLRERVVVEKVEVGRGV